MVMLYAKNSLAQKAQKFLPERRKGTLNGWETVNCQSLAFLTLKLPGKASNREMTKPHQDRLAEIMSEWAVAEESEEEEEEEEAEKDDEEEDPTYDGENPVSNQEESSGSANEDDDES